VVVEAQKYPNLLPEVADLEAALEVVARVRTQLVGKETTVVMEQVVHRRLAAVEAVALAQME
jgi:hypothetical protein